MKNYILIFCVYLSFGLTTKDTNKYSISDMEYKYTFYTTGKKIKVLKPTKKYFWYRSQKIHNTDGNYNGLLLDGVFIKSYRSNQLAEKGVFKNGLKQKVWSEWFKNGNRKSTTIWDNGVKAGKYFEFNEQGEIKIKGKYSKGKKIGAWINKATSDTLYYKKGVLLKEKPKSIRLRSKLFFQKIFKRDSLKKSKRLETKQLNKKSE